MLKQIIVVCIVAMAAVFADDDPCTNVKTQLNTLFNQIKTEYDTNLKTYYQSIAPSAFDPFNNTNYLYSVQGNDYKCYTIFETLSFLMGDVYPRATTNESVRLSLAKVATSSTQGAMVMNLCRQQLGCGPPPFDAKTLYDDRAEYGADDIMATLDTALAKFKLVLESENVV
ncbi:ORF_029L [Scale drop disease virus]|uniref:ORF_029L n=1 Tax=Scale drop disease virus TaxID=1697349 RepID=A0A0K1L6F3_9VIRU|nr:ORF_029L [Scale drop disease virus]AKU37444.1 ORF_029L [Scale drop disease virus]UNH60754.1 hypothetical protein SDDV_ORF085 [Scale drop disease virus]